MSNVLIIVPEERLIGFLKLSNPCGLVWTLNKPHDIVIKLTLQTGFHTRECETKEKSKTIYYFLKGEW